MKYFYLLLLFLIPLGGFTQDLEDLLDEEDTEIDFTMSTFKTTRLINGHTNEHDAKGVLNFRISHRFGPPDTENAAYNFFGMDNANIRLGFEYGLSNRIMIGLGRTKEPGKTIDAFGKIKLLRQSKGARKMPISVSYFTSMVANTLRPEAMGWPEEHDNSGAHRMSYTHQLIITKKFNHNLSLLLSPTLVHRNLKLASEESNDILAVGMGGRYMISGSTSINVEYYMASDLADGYYNSFAIGVDIETGGHVFQLHLTNSVGMTEPDFITRTNTPFDGTGIRFGFNLSRVFNVNTK